MVIKNVIFDIGNVILRWQPEAVVAQIFPQHDTPLLTKKLFKSSSWLDLNLGKITEKDLVGIYHNELGLELMQLKELMVQIKESLLPIPGSFELLHDLHKINIPLYSITDNVREIITFLKSKYNFWSLFKGIAISAEIGYLKPAKEIYQYLLNNYNLKGHDCIFFDDVLKNVEGAKNAGIHAVQFANAITCRADIRSFLKLDSL